MSSTATERLQRILDLEERQGWRNRAVIGGLLAMGNRWSDDALAESISEEQVAAILLLMARYEEEDQDARPDTAAAIRAVLAGEIADDVRTLMAGMVARTGVGTLPCW